MPSLVKKELFYLKWILTAQITSTCNLNQYKVSPYAFSSNEIIERVCEEWQKLMLVCSLIFKPGKTTVFIHNFRRNLSLLIIFSRL